MVQHRRRVLCAAIALAGCGGRHASPPALSAPPVIVTAAPPPTGAAPDLAAPPPRVAADRPPGFEQSCHTLVRDAAAWYDLEDVTDADERALMAWLVRFQVATACELWGKRALADRSCFVAARDASEEHDCVYRSGFELFPASGDDLAPMRAARAAMLADPAEITCERVALAYYSNVHWWAPEYGGLTGAAPGPRDLDAEQAYTPNVMTHHSAAEQTALIAATRAAFAAACAAERWSPSVRACIRVAPAGVAEERCLRAVDGSIARVRRWSTPPLDRVTTYEPACDVYLAAARGLADCAPSFDVDTELASAASFARVHARLRAPARPDPALAARCTTATARAEQLARTCLRLP